MLKTNLLFIFLTFIASDDYIILGSLIPKERISNGDVATIEEFPFIVALTIYLFPSIISPKVCGGSLIGPKTVLTAAHCVNDFGLPSKNISIRAGSDNNTDGGILVSAINHVIHPKYNPNSTDYDIAIIELESEVIAQGLETAVIRMWNESSVPFEPNTSCCIVGWGEHAPDDIVHETQLEEKEIFLLDSLTCQSKLQICANHPSGATCFGDSGGPLIIGRKLAGITSSGPLLCGDPKSAYYYFTSVPAFRNWIRENSGI